MRSDMSRILRHGVVAALLGWVAAACGAGATGSAPITPSSGGAPVPEKVAVSENGVVVAAQPLAAAAGVRILEMGGNAADAAVAAAFAISVVEPSMNSIGGRTQVLVRTADGRFHGIDATTQAPDTYDPDTAPQADYGYPTVGVPGAVAGLAKLLDEHGTLPLETVMAPAIRLAREGFALLPGEAARQGSAAEEIAEFEGSRASFLKSDGSTYAAGDRFAQEDLARTLEQISAQGPDVFYRGAIAERMAADVEAHGGALTRASLAAYRAEDARVVRGDYRGYELVGTFTPASGATTIEILHILEHFSLADADGATWAAVVAQAVALGFEDRRELDGDPRAAESMVSKERAAQLAARIRLPAAVPAPPAEAWLPVDSGLAGLAAGRLAFAGAATAGVARLPWTGPAAPDDDGHTTHLSTADASGMAVALTQTIGPSMGSKVATPGLGFLYAATLGGYLGRVEPSERASSSISPLIVLRDGEPVLVLGAAGGARIVSAVVQAVVRVIDGGMSLEEALAAPRVHASGETVDLETTPGIGWSAEVAEAVRGMGFEVRETPREGAFGRIHGIARRDGVWIGAADPDWEGAAIAPRVPQ